MIGIVIEKLLAHVTRICFKCEAQNRQPLHPGLDARRCAKEAKNKELIAKSSLALGNVYSFINDFAKALEHHLDSLKMYEEIRDRRSIALAMANVGMVYRELGEYDKSLGYIKNALPIFLGFKDSQSAAQCYMNIGSINRELKNFKESLENFAKALSIFRENGAWRGIMNTQIRLGNTYNDMGDCQRALDSYSEALKISKTLGSPLSMVACLNGMGYSFMKLKDFNRAHLALQEALKLASESKNKGYLKDNYRITSELYASQGDYKKALEFLKLQMKTESELINEKNLQHINNLQIQYDTLKRKSENERLLHENELQGLRLTKAKLVRNASVVGFAMILVILALLFQKYLYLFAFWKKEKYIGRYRLLDRIAAGGMSVVYKAHSIKEKSEKVAVKILKEEFSRDDSVIKRFKQEAMIIDKLDHPNIVKIHERGEDRNRLFIAMEYLDGKTLAEVIAKESPIDLDVSLHIMTQLADALSQIHGKKIVHRDLKPSNIIVLSREGDDHFVKLLDFGLARARFQSTLTQTGELLGTIGYMSPEQLLDGEVTTASDIYSLGVIFYETVCSVRAFAGENEILIIKRILDEMPKAPRAIRPEVPDAWNQLILQMLDKDPGRRPSLEEFKDQADGFKKFN